MFVEQVHRIHDLAVDVELELIGGGVPMRTGREPRYPSRCSSIDSGISGAPVDRVEDL